jgi:hypothetical protein
MPTTHRTTAFRSTLQKRFSNGVLINTNYTWQKSLDGQSSLAEVKVQNPFDRRLGLLTFELGYQSRLQLLVRL